METPREAACKMERDRKPAFPCQRGRGIDKQTASLALPQSQTEIQSDRGLHGKAGSLERQSEREKASPGLPEKSTQRDRQRQRAILFLPETNREIASFALTDSDRHTERDRLVWQA